VQEIHGVKIFEEGDGPTLLDATFNDVMAATLADAYVKEQ
jgi:hypothetical protein